MTGFFLFNLQWKLGIIYWFKCRLVVISKLIKNKYVIVYYCMHIAPNMWVWMIWIENLGLMISKDKKNYLVCHPLQLVVVIVEIGHMLYNKLWIQYQLLAIPGFYICVWSFHEQNINNKGHRRNFAADRWFHIRVALLLPFDKPVGTSDKTLIMHLICQGLKKWLRLRHVFCFWWNPSTLMKTNNKM